MRSSADNTHRRIPPNSEPSTILIIAPCLLELSEATLDVCAVLAGAGMCEPLREPCEREKELVGAIDSVDMMGGET
ncbi:unnamed protein product [Mycena citricolor]|uniref:Uncharacterized protein n=1 Tax=Mycena citricolor TaxID=2018698 RepID=A0AAD2HER6_9AGAR|nr:unnamed protein product [Mycena citricolor]